MRALVIHGPGEVRLEDVDPPVCGADEVIIRSRKAALCGTDLKIVRGELPEGVVSYPCIPGHEWSGTVAQVGGRINDLELGTPVVSEGMLRCDRCARCLAGETNLCANYAQLGFTLPGGFGEFVLAPRRLVHPLPAGLSLDAAALIEPAACALRALERSHVSPGESLAVVGVGGIGSLVILMASAFAAGPIVAYGVRRPELALADRLGVDAVVDVQREDVARTTKSGPQAGFDVVVETSGTPDGAETAITIARRGGRIVLVGTAGTGSVLSLRDDALVRKELTVRGSLSYTSSTWKRTLALAGHGEFHLEDVITCRFPVEDYGSALRVFEEGEIAGRVLLDHDQTIEVQALAGGSIDPIGNDP